MPYNSQLQSYIISSRASGLADEQIKANLLANGWQENDVQDALSGHAVPFPQSESSHNLSSSGIRFANYLIDTIFLVFVRLLLMVVIAVVMAAGGYNNLIWNSVLAALLSFILYYLVFEAIWQRTPAKFITGTKVTMEDGSKPDFWHILGRTFARFIPFEPFSFLFGPRGWHDSLSKTIVVPKNYTPEEVRQIDLKQKNGHLGWIGIIIGAFVFLMIVGILASVILVSLNSGRAKSRDARRVSDIKRIQTSLELYAIDHSPRYPNSLQDLVNTRIIDSIPNSVMPPDGDCSVINNQYIYIPQGNSYSLAFCLGSATDTFNKGINTVSPPSLP